MILDNISNLLLETEEVSDDRFIKLYLEDMTSTTKKNTAIHVAGMLLPIPFTGLVSTGYLIYRYFTSYYRLSRKVEKYSDLLDEAKKRKDVADIEEYTVLLNTYIKKLEIAKAKLRRENIHFVEVTKGMRSKLDRMKKNKSNSAAIRTLEDRIKQREAFIEKIGAKL